MTLESGYKSLVLLSAFDIFSASRSVILFNIITEVVQKFIGRVIGLVVMNKE